MSVTTTSGALVFITFCRIEKLNIFMVHYAALSYFCFSHFIGTKRRTIYEYHRVVLNTTYIEEGTIVLMNPEPSMYCLGEKIVKLFFLKENNKFMSTTRCQFSVMFIVYNCVKYLLCINSFKDFDICFLTIYKIIYISYNHAL